MIERVSGISIMQVIPKSDTLSATLEYPKPTEIEHLKTLYNPHSDHDICERYGKNYGVGTE